MNSTLINQEEQPVSQEVTDEDVAARRARVDEKRRQIRQATAASSDAARAGENTLAEQRLAHEEQELENELARLTGRDPEQVEAPKVETDAGPDAVAARTVIINGEEHEVFTAPQEASDEDATPAPDTEDETGSEDEPKSDSDSEPTPEQIAAAEAVAAAEAAAAEPPAPSTPRGRGGLRGDSSQEG